MWARTSSFALLGFVLLAGCGGSNSKSSSLSTQEQLKIIDTTNYFYGSFSSRCLGLVSEETKEAQAAAAKNAAIRELKEEVRRNPNAQFQGKPLHHLLVKVAEVIEHCDKADATALYELDRQFE